MVSYGWKLCQWFIPSRLGDWSTYPPGRSCFWICNDLYNIYVYKYSLCILIYVFLRLWDSKHVTFSLIKQNIIKTYSCNFFFKYWSCGSDIPRMERDSRAVHFPCKYAFRLQFIHKICNWIWWSRNCDAILTVVTSYGDVGWNSRISFLPR